MAGSTVTLNLKIAGADQVKTALKSVGNVLKTAFAASVGGDLAQSLGRIADAAQNNAAKLRIVTKSAQEFARAQADVLAISQLTGSAIAATTNLYSKLAVSLGRLNASQTQLATVTQAVSQALLVSGATTQGAIGALTQLGQAFNSGVLRGQEFNSVAEQAPRLLQAIADEMDVPVQALRGLARQGKITSDVLLRALTGEGAAKIAAEAANIPLTIGRAFTQLQNVLERYIGDADKATGASRLLVGAISGIAENIGVIAPLLAGAGFLAFAVAVGRSTAALVSFAVGFFPARASAVALAQANVVLAASQNTAAIATLRAAEAASAAAVGANAQALATVRLAETQIAAAIAANALTAAQIAALAASRGIGASLLALVGGPIGAVVVGLGLIYAGFQLFKSESDKAIDASISSLEQETQAIQRQIGVIEAKTRALRDGVSVDTAASTLAAEKNAEALEKARAKTEELGNAALLTGNLVSVQGAQFLYSAYQTGKLAERITGLAEEKEKLKAKTQALAIAEQDGESALDRIASAARSALSAFNSLITPTAALSEEIAKQTKTINDQLVKASGGDPFENMVRGQILLRIATFQSTDALKSQLETYISQRDTLESVEKANDAFAQSQKDAGSAIETAANAAATAMERLDDIARDLSQQFSGPATQANERYEDTMNRIEDALTEVVNNEKNATVVTRAFAVANLASADAFKQKKAALEDIAKAQKAADDAVTNYTSAAEIELRNLGLSREERRINEAGLRAEKEFRDLVNEAMKNQTGEYANLTQAQIDNKAQAARTAAESAESSNIMAEAGRKAAEEYARYWDQAFDSVIDAAFQGGESLKNVVKNILLDIAKMFAKKFILNIGAQVQGGGGIGGLISSLFGGGGALGKGGKDGAISPQGIISQFAGGGGGGGGLLAGLSQIPVAGWIAAAIAVNAQLYQSGWRPQGGSVEFGNGGIAQGGGIGGGILRAGIIPGGDIALIVNGLLNRIGVNPRVSAFLTGAAILTRLFGRKAPEIVDQTNTLNVGAGSATGGISANILERGGVFRSDRRSVGTTGLTPELQAQAEQMRAAISSITSRALSQLTDTLTSNITGAFVTVQDKTGKVTDEYVTVLGVKYRESVESGIKRIGAENIFAELEAITGESLQTFAAGFRGNADALLDAAQSLALAQSDIKAGSGFGLALGDISDLLKENSLEGDSLVATYERIKGAVITLDAVVALTGVSLEKTRLEFVQFAVDIADAAGGTQQAAALWETYFETFYTAEERALSATETANKRRTEALAAIGLDANTTAEQFRETFERLLPTLTPEQIVAYLRAGSAIGAAADAQAAYNDVLSEGAEDIANAALALNDLEQSLRNIEQQLAAGFTELERDGFTDFERGLLTINDNLQQTTASLLEQRSAAVAAGASAQTLARFDLALGRAQLLAASQAALAIEKLRKAARSLIDQLYGKGAAQSFGDAGTQAFNNIGDAAQSMYEAQLNSIKTIQDYLNGQLLGSTSTLTPVQQFDEAQRQFNAAIIAGNAQEAVRLADVLLRLGQQRFASSQPYTDLESAVRAALQGLLGSIGQPVGPIGNGGTGGAGSPEEFDAAARENRLELALQLSEIVRELLIATGDSLAEIAASIGLNMTSLVTDLGVNLTDLSVGTASSLATIAQSLGIELSELAENVGVDLGNLADSQSLINGALKAAIDALPADQRDALKLLLENVESAALTGGPLEINRAIGLLEDEVNLIGGATASALAPFFRGVNPVDPLNSIDSAVRALYKPGSLLEQIKNGIAELVRRTALPQGQPAPPITPPSGTNSVYVPNAAAPAFRGSAPTPSTTEGNAAVVEQLKRTVARLESLEATVRSGTTQQVRATVGVGETIVSANDKRQPVKPKLVMSE